MGINRDTLLEMSKELAHQYPYTVGKIYRTARMVAEVYSCKTIEELTEPLTNRLSKMMMRGL